LKIKKDMLYFIIEKAGMEPKRQTPGNRRAQSRASAKAEWQIAEVKEIFRD